MDATNADLKHINLSNVINKVVHLLKIEDHTVLNLEMVVVVVVVVVAIKVVEMAAAAATKELKIAMFVDKLDIFQESAPKTKTINQAIENNFVINVDKRDIYQKTVHHEKIEKKP